MKNNRLHERIGDEAIYLRNLNRSRKGEGYPLDIQPGEFVDLVNLIFIKQIHTIPFPIRIN